MSATLDFVVDDVLDRCRRSIEAGGPIDGLADPLLTLRLLGIEPDPERFHRERIVRVKCPDCGGWQRWAAKRGCKGSSPRHCADCLASRPAHRPLVNWRPA